MSRPGHEIVPGAQPPRVSEGPPAPPPCGRQVEPQAAAESWGTVLEVRVHPNSGRGQVALLIKERVDRGAPEPWLIVTPALALCGEAVEFGSDFLVADMEAL